MNLPRRTKAAILVAQKRPLEIVEIDLPRSLDVGQVLVELSYSGICGSQLGEIDGVKGADDWLPHLLGHEGSGVVLQIGPGVRHVNPGDFVILHWKPSKGIESNTPKYQWGSQVVNGGWVTTFNEHAVVSENRLTKIDASVDLMTAALYGCAVTTGFGVIDNRAQVKLGENIVVFGSGGIGLNIIQAARLAGANQVIAVDLYDNRLELSRHCGATELINSATQDPWSVIKSLLGDQDLDVFIDNTGNHEIISKGYEMISSRGRVVLVGVPKKGARTSIDTLPLHFGKSIAGTHGGEAVPHKDIPRYMNLFDSRNIDLGQLISEVKSLEHINEMISHMRDGTSAGRCLIKF
ncbi:zinc-binding dehydrogenase [Polynucleobacter sp. MWH-UH23A]|uniref:zinc-binding dehydrogenase n=1 Tax=Polynucleobacter sp. MWH-UH23A TaxID=1855613 RepID=UPI003364F4C3